MIFHQCYNEMMFDPIILLKDHPMLPVPSVSDQVDLTDAAHKEQLNSIHALKTASGVGSANTRSEMLPVRTDKAILTHNLFTLFTVWLTRKTLCPQILKFTGIAHSFLVFNLQCRSLLM